MKHKFSGMGIRIGYLGGLFILLLGGCAPQGLFYWGDYESSLYQRYVEQNPSQAEAYLKQTIAEAERANYRIPPGVYADYGYLLYRRDEKRAAIAYFGKEKKLYPESTLLMDKLIERVRLQMHDQTETREDVIGNKP